MHWMLCYALLHNRYVRLLLHPGIEMCGCRGSCRPAGGACLSRACLSGSSPCTAPHPPPTCQNHVHIIPKDEPVHLQGRLPSTWASWSAVQSPYRAPPHSASPIAQTFTHQSTHVSGCRGGRHQVGQSGPPLSICSMHSPTTHRPHMNLSGCRGGRHQAGRAGLPAGGLGAQAPALAPGGAPAGGHGQGGPGA